MRFTGWELWQLLIVGGLVWYIGHQLMRLWRNQR
jgi:hypothetical protein